MTAPLLPAHGSAAPLASPTSVERGSACPPQASSAPEGDGGCPCGDCRDVPAMRDADVLKARGLFARSLR